MPFYRGLRLEPYENLGFLLQKVHGNLRSRKECERNKRRWKASHQQLVISKGGVYQRFRKLHFADKTNSLVSTERENPFKL